MSENGQPTYSPSYLLPDEDTQILLNREELRPIRFALEYSKAELLLHDSGIRSTVIVFGSALIPSPEQAAAALSAAGTRRTASAPSWPGSSRSTTTRPAPSPRVVSERGGALVGPP